MNLQLNLDIKSLKKLLPMLRQAQPYVVGVALVAVFAYTAYIVNAALNVQAAATSPTSVTAPSTSSITFDKKTIESVKNLQVVQGDVPTGALGTSDPFK